MKEKSGILHIISHIRAECNDSKTHFASSFVWNMERQLAVLALATVLFRSVLENEASAKWHSLYDSRYLLVAETRLGMTFAKSNDLLLLGDINREHRS
jgi:hypothetical protein